MNDPLVLKAWLSRVGDKIKIRWTSPSARPFEYQLNPDVLRVRVTACRQALELLQRVADAPQEEGLPAALRNLRLSGEELYRVLMAGDRDKPAAAPFRAWFEATVGTTDPGTWRIEFQHEQPYLTVPWGLTCAPGGTAGEGTTFDDYIDLWAHRYTVASSVGAYYGAPTPINGGAIQCSLLLEVSKPSEATETTRIQLQVADHDGSDMTMWLTAPLLDHTIDRVSALRKKFRARADWNHVVYLNLHATGRHYSFPNDEEPLTPDELQRIKNLLIDDAHAIVMIDRDAIIRGDRGQDWLETFFNQQWAGLIAAETDITAKALRFRGFRFLMELLSRRVPLTESLVDVRRLLWPYSLLYGVYSNPERVFVSPTPEVVKELRAALEKQQ